MAVSLTTNVTSFNTSGSAYPVTANHLKVIQLPNATIQQWDVSMKTDLMQISTDGGLSKAKRTAIMRFKRNIMSGIEMKKVLGRGRFIYDGGAIAWSINSPFTTLDHEIVMQRGEKEHIIVVSMRKTTEINLEVLHQYLEKRYAYGDAILQCLTFLDALLAEGPKSRYPIVPSNNSYFDRNVPANITSIGGGVELLRGIFQSIRPALGTMTVNVDVSYTCFYRPNVSIVELLVENLHLSAELQIGNLNSKQTSAAKSLLRGLAIYTKHVPRRNSSIRNEKISCLSKMTAAQLRFTDSSGREVSVAQYFKNQYNINLKYPTLPLLELLGPKQNTIPLELCFVATGNKFPNSLLTGPQISKIVTTAATPPAERQAGIMQSIKSLGHKNDEHLMAFGMKISSEAMQATARLLPPPEIKFGQGRNPIIRPREGKWNIKGQHLVVTPQISSWAIICVDGPEPNLDNFIRELVNSATNFGTRLVSKQPYIEKCLRTGDVQSAIRTASYKCQQRFGGMKPELLIFILQRTPNPYLYGEIKYVCDIELGIPSQVVGGKNLRNKGSQLTDNIWLKVNPKVGGRNVELNANPFRRPFVSRSQQFLLKSNPRRTLLLGADVSHPPPGKLGGTMPSIVSLVSNSDAKATTFIGQARSQAGRVEIIEALQSLTENALINFRHTTKITKETLETHGFNVIYYRDGVGEQQFAAIKEIELAAIKKALKNQGLPFAKVTIVICQKRKEQIRKRSVRVDRFIGHHTRLFPVNARDGDNKGNAGTLLDSTITHPVEFDFFLVSHSAIKGTARPTKYHVIYDEQSWGAEAMHKLTNDLCYIYARSTTSVSLVSVAYYAHLVGNRARAYCRGSSSEHESVSSAGYEEPEKMLPSLNTAYVFHRPPKATSNAVVCAPKCGISDSTVGKSCKPVKTFGDRV